jgi:uncharacterized protein with GYD domain
MGRFGPAAAHATSDQRVALRDPEQPEITRERHSGEESTRTRATAVAHASRVENLIPSAGHQLYRREQMPSYITLMNWTDQGVKTFKDSVDRADAAEVALSPAGIKFKDVYWTVGVYDVIATFEAPDEETLAAALLTLAAQGNLRTTTLRAFTADEMKGVIAKAR